MTFVPVIDSRIRNHLEPVAAFGVTDHLVFLDPHGDGVEQMAAWLKSQARIQAMHIVSDGAQAPLQLGAQELSPSTLPMYWGLLYSIGSALHAEGGIRLDGYGVASGWGRREFVEELARLTGADVAASSNPTGPSDHGGGSSHEIHILSVTEQVRLEDSTLDDLGIALATLPTAAHPASVTGDSEGFTSSHSARGPARRGGVAFSPSCGD